MSLQREDKTTIPPHSKRTAGRPETPNKHGNRGELKSTCNEVSCTIAKARPLLYRPGMLILVQHSPRSQCWRGGHADKISEYSNTWTKKLTDQLYGTVLLA